MGRIHHPKNGGQTAVLRAKLRMERVIERNGLTDFLVVIGSFMCGYVVRSWGGLVIRVNSAVLAPFFASG